MTALTPTSTALTPVSVPRNVAMEFLLGQAMRLNCVRDLKLVHCPHLLRTNASPKVLCPCDHGVNTCVTAVPLNNIRFRIEGWLLAEMFAGQCPHCRRVYWG